MKILFVVAGIFLISMIARAENFVVFSVKNEFPMSDTQTQFRDIYVNMGTAQGIKVGSKLDAYRVLSTVDEINQKTSKNISFKIARLKVIHAENEISVARVIEYLSPESIPNAGYGNVMVGDRVDVANR